MEFLSEGIASNEVGIYTCERLAPENIGIATEIVSISVSVANVIGTSGLGYSFYFRFVSDGVLHSRSVSTQVEVDRACPKTVS